MPKTPAKTSQPPQSRPPDPPQRRSLYPFIGVIVVLAIVAAFYTYQRSSGPAATDQPASPGRSPQSAAVPAATPVSNEVPASAKFGPHTQETYPPLPDTGYPPPRPVETVREVYRFAAEHPEVLSYIPCYCGCDRQGHKGNDDCFVAERNANGDVQAWDPHGMT